MIRLTLLLCAGMYAALMTLGSDKGQLRPGLALAASEGRLDEVWAEARAKAAPRPRAEPAAEVVLASATPEPAPVAEPEPVVEAPVVAKMTPSVEVVPGREVVQLVEEPVFSLASYGNEPIPGADGATAAVATETAAQPEALPGEGTIWYVKASSVNVRSAPSTDAEVLGKLYDGEATLMVAAVDGDWARIVIQGDGMEGFVALRYLSPEAP